MRFSIHIEFSWQTSLEEPLLQGIQNFPVGGKTGTAQKVLSGGRGYSHTAFMSSFVGFAPADNPRYAMVVVLDEARPLYYGGTVAAPVFKEVLGAALLTQGAQPYHESAPPITPEQVAATADLAADD